MNKDLFSKTNQLIILIIFVSFFSGYIGSVVAGKYAPDNLAGKGSPVKTIEQRSYVEESQSIDAIKKVSPAVVSIVATADLKVYYSQPFPFFQEPGTNPFGFPEFQFNIPRQQAPKNPGKEGKDYEIKHEKVSGGSGFIISAEGLVLTNRHVLSDQNVEYTIISSDGTEYDGEIVSVDPLNDIAVLQMVKKDELKKPKESRTRLANLPTVELGASEKLEVGQKVFAIGYALGQYENTVTSGIISAKNREITASGGAQGAEKLSGLLQTDAAINPGNSGGPLTNLAGQVIGVNVAIDASGAGIGFAIPINDVKSALDSIKKNGRIVRPGLGVRHIILSKAKAKELKIDVDHGALLIGDEQNGEFAVIPGSAADKAGLKTKDVILSVDGKDINPEYTLQDAIRNHQPNDEITLKVWRSGEIKTFKAKLGEAKDEAADFRAKT